MRIGSLVRWAIAGFLVVMSFVNASWLAPAPPGALQMIAARPGAGDACPSLKDTREALIAAGGPVVLDAAAKPGCMNFATALEQLPRYKFILKTDDAAGTLAAFEKLERPVDERYGFIGDAATVATIRARAPKAWAFTIAEGRACFEDYVKLGWLAMVPESCRGKTILVPLDEKWKVAGWPRRFQARMKAAGTQVILTAPGKPADAIPGITTLEQIPEVPRAYTGYLWVDAPILIGRSIRR